MKRGHISVVGLLIIALLVGVSISAGPVAWVVLAMIAPLVIIMMFTARGAAHARAGVSVGRENPDSRQGSDPHQAASPEARHAALVHDQERAARRAAEEYARVHQDD